jgi:hypothetical protein
MAMAKKTILPFVLALFVLNGCAATNKQPDLQVAPITTPIVLTYKPYTSVEKYVGSMRVGRETKKFTAEGKIQVKNKNGDLTFAKTRTLKYKGSPDNFLEVNAVMSPIGEISTISEFTHKSYTKASGDNEKLKKIYSRVINNPVKTGTIIFDNAYSVASPQISGGGALTTETVRGRSIYKNTSVIVTDTITIINAINSEGKTILGTFNGYSIYDEHTMQLLYIEIAQSMEIIKDKKRVKIKGSYTYGSPVIL